MTVKVLYFAALRDLFGCAGESLELEQGSTLADLGALLSARKPGFQGHLKSLAWGLNFEYAQSTAMLKSGDEVALLPPVSGGAA